MAMYCYFEIERRYDNFTLPEKCRRVPSINEMFREFSIFCGLAQYILYAGSLFPANSIDYSNILPNK